MRPSELVGAPTLLARNPLHAPSLEERQQLLCLRAQRPQSRILRLPFAADLLHHKHRVALDDHVPLAVLERDTEPEDQRVPFGRVVGPLSFIMISELGEVEGSNAATNDLSS